MRTQDWVPAVAWAMLGILVASSALGVVAAKASGILAVAVILGGVTAALLLSWAAQPAPGSGAKAIEPPGEERRRAA
jgi:hypothetical protein